MNLSRAFQPLVSNLPPNSVGEPMVATKFLFGRRLAVGKYLGAIGRGQWTNFEKAFSGYAELSKERTSDMVQKMGGPEEGQTFETINNPVTLYTIHKVE